MWVSVNVSSQNRRRRLDLPTPAAKGKWRDRRWRVIGKERAYPNRQWGASWRDGHILTSERERDDKTKWSEDAPGTELVLDLSPLPVFFFEDLFPIAREIRTWGHTRDRGVWRSTNLQFGDCSRASTLRSNQEDMFRRWGRWLGMRVQRTSRCGHVISVNRARKFPDRPSPERFSVAADHVPSYLLGMTHQWWRDDMTWHSLYLERALRLLPFLAAFLGLPVATIQGWSFLCEIKKDRGKRRSVILSTVFLSFITFTVLYLLLPLPLVFPVTTRSWKICSSSSFQRCYLSQSLSLYLFLSPRRTASQLPPDSPRAILSCATFDVPYQYGRGENFCEAKEASFLTSHLSLVKSNEANTYILISVRWKWKRELWMATFVELRVQIENNLFSLLEIMNSTIIPISPTMEWHISSGASWKLSFRLLRIHQKKKWKTHHTLEHFEYWSVAWATLTTSRDSDSLQTTALANTSWQARKTGESRIIIGVVNSLSRVLEFLV